MQEYHRQLRQRPHMISTSSVNEANKSGEKKKNAAYQTRTKKRLLPLVEVLCDSESSSETEYSDSTGHSDWVAEEDANAESRKRTRQRRINYNSDDESEEESVKNESHESSDEKERPQPVRVRIQTFIA